MNLRVAKGHVIALNVLLVMAASISGRMDDCSRGIRVCGSDGRTYTNECIFRIASHVLDGLTVRHYGSCITKGKPFCLCEPLLQPVCGTNGVTYSNICQLKCEMKENKDLTLFYNHECPDQAYKRSYMVPVTMHHAYDVTSPPCCKYLNSNGTCDDGACPKDVDYHICGSDKILYPNICSFCCAKSKNPEIAITTRNRCKSRWWNRESDRTIIHW